MNDIIHFDSASISRIEVSHARLNFLKKNVPACPVCAETQQIQLVEYIIPPAQWKCRICKNKWSEEPIKT